MKITLAIATDIPLLQKLAEESWRANYRDILCAEQIDYMLRMMYSRDELQKHFDQAKYCYHLIWDGEMAVGFIGFEHDYEPQTTKLHRIYLLQECKGRGLGSLALKFLEETVRNYGNRRIILNVNKGNPAREFYSSQGYLVYDKGVFDIGNGFVMDDVLMEKFV